MIVFRILFLPFALLFLIGSVLFTLPLLIIDKGIYDSRFIKGFSKGFKEEINNE